MRASTVKQPSFDHRLKLVMRRSRHPIAAGNKQRHMCLESAWRVQNIRSHAETGKPLCGTLCSSLTNFAVVLARCRKIQSVQQDPQPEKCSPVLIEGRRRAQALGVRSQRGTLSMNDARGNQKAPLYSTSNDQHTHARSISAKPAMQGGFPS